MSEHIINVRILISEHLFYVRILIFELIFYVRFHIVEHSKYVRRYQSEQNTNNFYTELAKNGEKNQIINQTNLFAAIMNQRNDFLFNFLLHCNIMIERTATVVVWIWFDEEDEDFW